MIRDSSTEQPWNVRVTRIGGWKALVMLIPVALLVLFAASVLFAVMMTLLAAGAAVLGIRIWWLKRKMRSQGGQQVLDGEYVVVERRSELLERRPDDR